MPTNRDEELEREIRTHLELEAEEHIAAGMSPEDAHAAARRSFGHVIRTREDVTAVWTNVWLDHFWRDLRQGLRSLRRSPRFTATAVVTLAVGIGATAAVFSAVDALLIRPIPVSAPEELYVVRRAGETRARFPFEFYRTLNEPGGVFSGVVASFTFPLTVVEGGTGTRAKAAFVTPNYFDVLGVRPQLGRSFRDEEGDALTVVVSHEFWRRRFNGRASMVGESVRVGRQPFVIVGVAPPDFQGLQLGLAVDLWIPMAASPEAIQIPAFRTRVDVVGRLAAGLSIPTATSRVRTEHQRWAEGVAPASAGARTEARSIVLRPASHGLESHVRDQFRASLSLLVGICACLWIITIVNVSGLLTARLRERQREIGIRLALGVTSARLFVQMLAEAVVLLCGGVFLGVVVAVSVAGAIPRWIPAWEGLDLRLSPLVLTITAATAVVTALMVALIQSATIDRRRLLSYVVPNVPRFAGCRFRVSTALVSGQLALTIPLIVTASLMVRSFVNLGSAETGFARSHLLQIEVEPVLVGYSPERASAYYTALLDRLRVLPGVSDASVSNGGALSGYDGIAALHQDGARHEVRTIAVGERYFSTLDIRVLSGRVFARRETEGDERVAIVNAALAGRFLVDEETAVGKTVTLEDGEGGDHRMIVGVVENTTDANLRDKTTPTLYVPAGRSALLVVHVRTQSDSAGSIPMIRQAAASLDPNVPILAIETIDSRRRSVLQRERLLAAASTGIACIALTLSAVGLFALVSYAVATRTREIGIRQALGARRSQIARLFLMDTARPLALGAMLGLGTSITLARTLAAFVYGVSPTDSIAYIMAISLLVLVAAGATLLPLRQTVRVSASANLKAD